MKRLFFLISWLISWTWALNAEAQSAADTVRILGVGNSWTRDSMRWLSAIAKSAGRPVIVGYGYLGGSMLEEQWRGITDTNFCYIHNGERQKVHSTYQYWKYTATDDHVKIPSEGYENGLAGIGVTLESIVQDEPWDWIVFQPEATFGGDYTRHLGQGTGGYSLAALITAVKNMMSAKAASKVRVGLMVPYAYAQGNTDYRKKFLEVYNDGETPSCQAEWDSLYRKQYRLIQQAAPLVCDSLSLDACINVGAAIEAARQDPDLSKCGYLLQRRQDNTHLAEGLPKYLASLCYAYSLLDISPEDVSFCPPGESPVLAGKAGRIVNQSIGQRRIPTRASEDVIRVMDPAYWALWNDEVQRQIDADIDRYRKADGEFRVGSVKKGTTVKVEQVSSEFLFGASTFNFNQLGSSEANARYRNLFGTLFNRATVGLYWRDFQWFINEPMRFAGEFRDSEDYWNNFKKKPFAQPHWRRPASDPIVEWCASQGVAVHLHPLAWGSGTNNPTWLHQLAPEGERKLLDSLEDVSLFESKVPRSERWESLSLDSLALLLPGYGNALGKAFDAHVRGIIDHYRNNLAVRSYDVVNESCKDWRAGVQVPGALFTKSRYMLLPGDYTRRTFKVADAEIPAGILKCINDYVDSDDYPSQVQTLLKEGYGVQAVGSQMHLYDPAQCAQIAAGEPIQSPDYVWDLMKRLSAPGLPICISEITITAPTADKRGEMIQAVIARNLYRLWFSGEKMFAITWWNLVDGCGFPGEPTTSGLFHRDMTPKAAYYALEELINHDWKTNIELKPTKGIIRWRGFKGTYRISWTDARGNKHIETLKLK